MAVSTNPHLVQPTKTTWDTFRKVFNLFARCHNTYNSGKAIDDPQFGTQILILPSKKSHTIDSFLELDVKEFLDYYREKFSATILPKMHLLEDHMAEWLKRFHLGAGFMGEQGAESIHAHLNRLENNLLRNPQPS